VNFTRFGPDLRGTAGERIHGQWLDLDRLLVYFWELRSIRPKVVDTSKEDWGTGVHFECLLPEITKRGLIDVGFRVSAMQIVTLLLIIIPGSDMHHDGKP
jgi:hypothetical protein